MDCFTRHEGLIENTTILVRYDGKPVVNSSVRQYFAFELAEETSSSYKMCVKPLHFIDPLCDVQLDIKSSYSAPVWMFIILFEYIYITRVLFRTLFKKMYLNWLFLSLLETNLTDTCIYTPVYRLIETFGDKGKITDCT